MDRGSEKSNGLIDAEDAGIVSIKDFAYDKSDALHYGYYGDHYEEDTDEDPDHQVQGSDESSGELDHNTKSFESQKIGSQLRDPSTLRGKKDAHDDIGDAENEFEDVMTKRQSIVLPSNQIVNSEAIALYDFAPENDNELELHEGDILFIGYRHGQGWLVAENEERTRTGLVPEEYVTLIETPENATDNDSYTTEENDDANNNHNHNHKHNYNDDDDADDDDDDDDDDKDGKPRPFYLTHMIAQSMASPAVNDEPDQEWEDIDDVESSLKENLRLSDS
ncbi:LAFA_0E19482g1_1 [Lachancea sp. 'fantastica']|nr:LAFA_0E19482g1_1 [Lachancea sp. 'fantastica']